MAKKQPAVHIAVFVILDQQVLDRLFGDRARHLEQDLSECLEAGLKEILGAGADKACVFSLADRERLVVWPSEHGGKDEGAESAYALKSIIQASLWRRMFQWTGQRVGVGVAHDHLDLSDQGDIEEAQVCISLLQRIARKNPDLTSLSLRKDFRKILRTGQLSIAYQAVADIAARAVHGWESLSRGPESGRTASTLVLFELAEEMGELCTLEKICRERALAQLGPMAPNQKIFLNSHPLTLADSSFSPGPLLEAFYRHGISPRNAVLEFGGGQTASDMDIFQRNLMRCRETGLNIAMGLGGSGDANLLTVAQVKPDYVKLDMSLVREIESSSAARTMAETFVEFARRIRAEVVAEGVERNGQAEMLANMGVRLAQGYLFSTPGNPKPGLSKDLRRLHPFQAESTEAASCSKPVGRITAPARIVSPETEVGEIRQIFEQDEIINSIVVAQDDRPLGLVSRSRLHRQLSTKFGLDLFVNRAVRLIMDEAPLMVDRNTPVEQAAHKAMARSSARMFEDIVITEAGLLSGVVTVKKLLETLASSQVEMAKGANPLTGLPGNITLEQELEMRVKAARSFEIIYADLDNFKVYNDTYGFKNGDEIIKLSSKILAHAVLRRGSSETMLCHVGGDDFVVITPPRTSEPLCESALRCFKRLVRNCYCQEDRTRGWIEAVGRDGAKGKFPLVALSLAIVAVSGTCSLQAIGERAAKAKKKAKAIEGNCWVREEEVCLPPEA
jgi:diguanylate cyclase (GGDEF)-like protein